MRVAVMQPYLWPYAGYFRLLAASDVFVVFDCVQFIRRGRIHRNEFTRVDGAGDWFTLPLAPAAQSERIDRMRFADDAALAFDARLPRFAALASAWRACASRHGLAAPRPGAPLVDWLQEQIAALALALGLGTRIVRSSALAVDPGLRAQERVLALCERLGARHYLNVAGGRALYDEAGFAERGMTLEFLADYPGPKTSVIERLFGPAAEAAETVRGEILASLACVR
ncbi:MAG: hypothetical protein AMXMBFR66_08970 [Pseudomonadota bacterium]|nr:WbqC family protein [Rubrivivax sp.]NLZ40995.1 WbqC family protein [Comamonadaceae bacterium]